MRCVEMSYEEAESVATASCSRKDPRKLGRLEKEYGKVYSPGNGWAYVYQTSRLLLVFENGKEVDVAPFFKEKWGKLTAGRRDAIEGTMPSAAKLIQGNLENAMLEAWLLRAQQTNTPKARKERAEKKAAEQAASEKRRQKEHAVFMEQLKREREENIASAPKLSFVKGWNNKQQRDQWRHRSSDGKLFVLRQEDEYTETEGPVPVEELRELVPGKIILVRRIGQI